MIEKHVLRKAQLKMVDILDEIDRICTKHNIKYWLSYGTLLGAVRHKGFIPWDDDCDICMMREDYEKFIKIAQYELSDNFFLQNKNTDPYYHRGIDKIRMNNTKLVESDESDEENYHQGIYVDIFIWDYYNPVIKYILDKLKIIDNWKNKRKNYPKGSFKRILIHFGTILPYLFSKVMKRILYVINKKYRDNKEYNFIGLSLEYKYVDMVVYCKDFIFPLKKCIEFEKKYFSVPNNSDGVLNKKYGNYMVLPKIEERNGHAVKIEV